MIRRLFSYLWPLTRRYPSEVSGQLEVNYINGKKVLDSKNANYSYGNLKAVLDYALDQCNLEPVEDCLILGLGAGSVLASLDERGFRGKITAVELDEMVLKIAREEFDLDRFNAQIIKQDAALFLADDDFRYDLIIVDLFIDDQVPVKFRQVHFWEQLCGHLSPKGQLIFNLGMWERVWAREESLRHIFEHYGQMEVKILEKVMGQNQVLIARRLPK